MLQFVFVFSFLQCYLSTTNLGTRLTVSSHQEKSQEQKTCAGNEKEVLFEKCIKLFASSRLSCGVIHSMERLHWTKHGGRLLCILLPEARASFFPAVLV
jgi:hypothetical protein